MMTWGAGWAGWLWMLAGLALMVGVVLIVVWAVQRAGGGPEDDALTALRGRFARGEIDAAQFEEMRRGTWPIPSRTSGFGLSPASAALSVRIRWQKLWKFETGSRDAAAAPRAESSRPFNSFAARTL